MEIISQLFLTRFVSFNISCMKNMGEYLMFILLLYKYYLLRYPNKIMC